MKLLAAMVLGVLPLQSQPQSLEARSQPPTDEQARDLLKAICPDGIQAQHLVANRSYPACNPCPAFTTRGGLRPADNMFFDFHSVVFGSFTSPGSHEAVADLYGCEDHASTVNFHSSVLLRKGPKGWRMISYEHVETSQCQNYPLPNGRDLLLCRGWAGHPDASGSWIFTYDFLEPMGQRERDLFGTVNTWIACRSTAIVGAIDSFDLCDLDHDGLRDLSVYVSVIKEEASGESGVCALDSSPPPAENFQIDFLFKEDNFIVAPWSVETKKALDELSKNARGGP